MAGKLCFLFVLAFFLNLQTIQGAARRNEKTIFDDKPTITVFYDSTYDVRTEKYFSKQLFQFYRTIEDNVILDLVPYGNMEYDSTTGKCKNQNIACIKNVYQALVINKYKDKAPEIGISGNVRIINFINCLLHQDTSFNPFISLESCSNTELDKADYTEFLEKLNTPDDVLKNTVKEMSDKTDKAKERNGGVLPRLPYIELNGKSSLKALNNFVKTVCDEIDPKPKICSIEPVKVDAYYEIFDHKTRSIFLEEVKALFDNLQNFIEFNFVPAGSLKENQINECEPERCDSLKYQICTINNYWNDDIDQDNYNATLKSEVFDAIQCVFKNKDMLEPAGNAEYCSELIIAADWSSINLCAKGEDGRNNLTKNIKETAAAVGDKSDFPYFYIEKESLSISEIREKVCKLFEDDHKPIYCTKDPAKKVKLEIYYQSDSELAKYFFTRQYEPWFKYIEEMVDIRLIPGGDSPLIDVDSDKDPTGECDDKPDNACVGDKIHSHIFLNYSKQDDHQFWFDEGIRTMNFMKCFFSDPKWKIDYIAASQVCAQELDVDGGFNMEDAKKDKVSYVKSLIDTKNFLKSIGKSAFELLPWISLTSLEKPDEKPIHSKRAVNDLLQTVCSYYLGDKPSECRPVNVEVYYSGFHSKSRKFFIEQLIPIFKNLRERIHLNLIPYGNVPFDEACSSACKTNKFQACAIKKYFDDAIDQDGIIQYDGLNQTLSYIQCMFKNIENEQNVVTLSEKCSNDIVILPETIRTCYDNEGKEALEEMKKKTNSLFEKMTTSPWVVVNGQAVKPGENGNIDLKQAICSSIIGDKPLYCTQDEVSKVQIELHYSAYNEESKNYILERLGKNPDDTDEIAKDYYRQLEEIIDIDFVPLGECEVLSAGKDKYYTKCPEHDNESKSNLIHACAISEIKKLNMDPKDEKEFDSSVDIYEFLKCHFKHKSYDDSPIEAAESCVKDKFGTTFADEVTKCANSQDGMKLLKENQDKQEALFPDLTYIPWITVNTKHNYAVENDFKRTVCDSYLGDEKPQLCYSKNIPRIKPSVSIHYEIDDPKSVDFFTKYFDAEIVSSLSNFEFIPFGRSTKDSDGKFKCVNNEDCKKYAQHGCLIKKQFGNEKYQIPIGKAIACTFENKVDLMDCLKKFIDDDDSYKGIVASVNDCTAKDDEVKQILEEAHSRASILKITHSPWVIINDEHNLEAEFDLPNEICAEYYPSDKPEGCQVKYQPVDIYYQSRDDDTFFSKQLALQVKYIDELGMFQFIPSGKTKFVNGKFECPGGEEQCHANMIHACLLDYAKNTPGDKTINFDRAAASIVCTFLKTDPAYIPQHEKLLRNRNTLIEETCIRQNFKEEIWNKIHTCFSTDKGTQLMNEMIKITQDAKIGDELPEVRIKNEVKNKTKTAFFQVLCNSYDIIKPALCLTLGDFGVKTSIYFSGNQKSADYFNNYLSKFYESITPQNIKLDDNSDERLYRLISPELIPWGKTKYENGKFVCDTDNECYINRFFACAISAHRKEPRAKLHLMEFSICFFKHPSAFDKPSEAAQACTNKVWIPDPFVSLEECATSNEEKDKNKLLIMQDLTKNNEPELTDFPSITINNMFNKEATDGKLFEVLCKNYEGIDRPASCPVDDGPKPSSALSASTASFILFIASLLFLIQL